MDGDETTKGKREFADSAIVGSSTADKRRFFFFFGFQIIVVGGKFFFRLIRTLPSVLVSVWLPIPKIRATGIHSNVRANIIISHS